MQMSELQTIMPTPNVFTHTYRTDHLSSADAQRLQSFADDVREWSFCIPPKPSFIVGGTVGVGKTTALNIMVNSCLSLVQAFDVDGPEGENGVMGHGRIYGASEIMYQMDPGIRNDADGYPISRTSLTSMFRDLWVIAIDDVGTEEIPYTASADKAITRQNRYGELIDHCYRHDTAVIISTMIPIFSGDDFNSQFVDVIGLKAFDRLLEMSGKYLHDLTGLPTFRNL